MVKRFLNITLLLSFLLISFSVTVCFFSKLNYEDISALVSNIAEEEDETEKDFKDTSNEFVELLSLFNFENLTASKERSIYTDNYVDLFVSKVNTPPPKSI